MYYHHHIDTSRGGHCTHRGESRNRSPRRTRGRRGQGGGGFRIGKMLRDGDLRLIVLALLAEQARHGYDIIKALEEHSSGYYSPSPGIVYPTLTYLEEAGYASPTSEGNKKVYTISEAGRAHLATNRDLVDAILSEIAKVGRKMSRASFDESDQRSWRTTSDRDIPHVIPEVNEARRALKQAIAEKLDASAEEQRRVARILQDAADTIRKSDPDAVPGEEIDLG